MLTLTELRQNNNSISFMTDASVHLLKRHVFAIFCTLSKNRQKLNQIGSAFTTQKQARQITARCVMDDHTVWWYRGVLSFRSWQSKSPCNFVQNVGTECSIWICPVLLLLERRRALIFELGWKQTWPNVSPFDLQLRHSISVASLGSVDDIGASSTSIWKSPETHVVKVSMESSESHFTNHYKSILVRLLLFSFCLGWKFTAIWLLSLVTQNLEVAACFSELGMAQLIWQSW